MIQADDIFKKIGYILNDLQDQQEYLAHHPEKINAPELELFMANANFLADHVKVYIRLKNAEVAEQAEAAASIVVPSVTEKEVHKVHKEEPEPEMAVIAEAEEIESRVDLEPVLPAFEDEVFKPDTSPAPFEFILDQKQEDDKFDFETKAVEDRFDRELSREEQEIINNKQQSMLKVEEEEDEIGPEPFLIAVPEPEVAEDKVAEAPEAEAPEPVKPVVPPMIKASEPVVPVVAEAQAKPTLNELLAKSKGTPVVAARKAPVADLKQAINLNDKLLFIKELFNGYNLAYAEVIDLINKMPDKATADAFLQANYATKNGWAEKQGTVERFYQILDQRFS